MFGSHLSIAGGHHHALQEARALRMDCVQIFTKNQRQWDTPPLTDDQCRTWFEHRKSTGIGPVVSHASYLINLAAPSGETRSKSLALFRDELLRCASLDIPYLVIHPGSHMKAGGPSGGLRRIASALNRTHRDLPDINVLTCLEVTAGQGTALGHRFEDLQRLLDTVRAPERLAVCIDTAHMLAAGYDLTSSEGARSVIDELDQVLGLPRVKVLHVNDSKTPRGSRVDRHEHLGHGHVARDAMRVVLQCSAFRHAPKILETAKEDRADGRPWDAVNLATMKRWSKAKKPTQRRASD